eukprot:maker-scaffold2453_size15579-snap-gene-0.7 protein:Tk07726 transcript:maker-scaffold2453_size15579-snap-gene-0.7-mRNA-1 annotation:"zinc transporter 1 isoform x2"
MDEALKLTVCTALTAVLLVAELVMGHFSHCLTLQALTNQSFYNLLTLGCATAALKLEQRNTQSSWRSSFGWARLEVVGSLSSLVFLTSLSFFTGIECLQTLFHNDHLDAMHQAFWVCVLGLVHFLVWLIMFVLIGGYSFQQSQIVESSSGIRLTSGTEDDDHPTHGLSPGKFQSILKVPNLNMFRDLIGCLFLILLSTGVYIFENHSQHRVKYIDPVLAMVSISIFLALSYPIAKQSGLILLQTIPEIINVNDLKGELFQKFPAILNIHEMHIWCLVPTNIVVTMHILFQNEDTYNGSISAIEAHMTSRGITKFTIQPEMMANQEGASSESLVVTDHLCLLRCSKGCRGCCEVKSS